MVSILITCENIYKYEHKKTLEGDIHDMMVLLESWALFFRF